MRWLPSIFSLFLAASSLAANQHPDLRGTVVDTKGQPVEHATVLVYSAGVKQGYSTVCPTCYADCGKRALTRTDGTFLIPSLDPDLRFRLVAVRDGFEPTFAAKIDPVAEATHTITLEARKTRHLPDRTVYGRVVDRQGVPVRDALIEPIGLSSTELWAGQHSAAPQSMYGTVPGLEPLAVSDKQGRFEVAYAQTATAILLKIEGRGFAPKVQAMPTGAERRTVTVQPGAVIRGRLVQEGQPVPGAEIGLIPRNRARFGQALRVLGDPYEEVRVGTQSDGSFVLPDVPTGVDWYVYAKMESVSKRGATDLVECSTPRTAEVVEVGDLTVKPACWLRGTVMLPDGSRLPDGMRLTLAADHGWDWQTTQIRSDGTFEFQGVRPDGYQITPGMRDYRALEGGSLSVDRDVDNFKLVLTHPPGAPRH